MNYRKYSIRPWTAEEESRLRNLVRTGNTKRQIAEIMGKSLAAIRGKINNSGIHFGRGTDRLYSDAYMENVVNEIKKGKSVAGLSEELGVSAYRIHRILKVNNTTATALKTEGRIETKTPHKQRNGSTPCMLEANAWPVCREYRCYLKTKCRAFSNALESGKVTERK